ncbi:MAG: alpha/beta hydrolase [Syntrophales bacterium]
MMKKRWIVMAAVGLSGLALYTLYSQHDTADPRSTCAPETALASERHSMRWHYKSPLKRRRGVALVVHGLNLKPEKMEPIIRTLNRAGIDALNVSLHGHGDNYVRPGRGGPREARLASFRTATYGLWSSEVRRAYDNVRERADRTKVPRFLVGYSLGALLGCDLLVSDAGVHFDRMALFAPALHVTSVPYLLKALMPFPGLVIDSRSPEGYRSNDGTPVAGYKALLEALDHFQAHITSALNVPTIVFLDRDDEFISSDHLEEMISRNNLDLWNILTIRKKRPEPPCAYHLLIDEAVTGKDVWERMAGSLLSHLLPAARERRTVRPPEKRRGDPSRP